MDHEDSIYKARQITFFRGVTDADLERERKVEELVRRESQAWQADGLAPTWRSNLAPIPMSRSETRGWTHWHHLFNARQLLLQALP